MHALIMNIKLCVSANIYHLMQILENDDQINVYNRRTK
jgi:hypothetical protein